MELKLKYLRSGCCLASASDSELGGGLMGQGHNPRGRGVPLANTGVPEEGVMSQVSLMLENSYCLGKKPRLLRRQVWMMDDARRHSEQRRRPEAANRKEQ